MRPALPVTKQMNPVLCLGELLIDFIVDDGATSLEEASHFAARPGGAPANVAVALARLGVPAAFCGAVGDDPFGARLRKILVQNGVAIEALISLPETDTTLAFAWKNASGDGNFRILRRADTGLTPPMVDSADVPSRSAIVLGSVGLTDEPSRSALYHAVDLARANNVPVVLDINIRPSLWGSRDEAMEACRYIMDRATILKLSVDDAAFLFGQRDPDQIFDQPFASNPILLLTDGARGSWLRTSTGQVDHVAAFSIEAVEPTGAGDAFTAAIISRFLRSNRAPDKSDVRFASAAGAITATRMGAIESLPYLREIEQFHGAV